MITEPEIRLDERRRLAEEITLTIQFLEQRHREYKATEHIPAEGSIDQRLVTAEMANLQGQLTALRNLQSRLRNKRKNRA